MTESEENLSTQPVNTGSFSSSESIRVLLVDDSHKNRRMARDVLGKAGYDVMTAADGFDALAKVSAHRPDIVFADSVLPRLDGYQTCALIRNNVDYLDVSVVMLSGGSQPYDSARARLVGIDASLHKPLTEEALLASIDQHIQKERYFDEPASIDL